VLRPITVAGAEPEVVADVVPEVVALVAAAAVLVDFVLLLELLPHAATLSIAAALTPIAVSLRKPKVIKRVLLLI
jgi:hypothetical protein